MAELHLIDVKKNYGETKVLHGITMHIHDGEFVVFVGPSGCGKSTLLRMIAGLEGITSGDLKLDDERINQKRPVERGMAMVFQSYALYPHMTVEENMAFSLKMAKVPRDEIKRRVLEAAKTLQMENLLLRRPAALSGGQRQRVAIGRAIVRNPKVFLFDEPLSNLDAKLRVEMRREILELHNRIRNTMIYVTHDQVEAMTLGDRICVLQGGVMQQMGTPAEVFDNPANTFVAGFIGTPPMNLIPGVLRADRHGVRFDGGGLDAALPPELAERAAAHIGSESWLGVRPRAITLADQASGGPVWKVRTAVMEMLGEESLVHLRHNDTALVMNIDPHALRGMDKVTMDKEIEVSPVMSRAHIFIKDGGTCITRDIDMPGRYSVRK